MGVPSGAGSRTDEGATRSAGGTDAPSAPGRKEARRRHNWRQVHERLSQRTRSDLTAGELDLLAEALFWLDQPDESVGVRRAAYAAHVAAGTMEGAARAAWQLFYDHFLVGETAVAGGWLDRARRHATEAASVVEAGFVAVADADCAAAEGNLDAAADHAHRALEVARAAGDPDLTAMALQARGRMLVACGQPREGMALLDEAMLAAVNGELAPLFTGWVYCNVLSTCHDVADLRRAGEWNDAAMRWCEQLRDGAFYPGICRLHVVELACLRETWEAAEAHARRACGELTAHDPRFAGEAYYLTGEMRRLMGDLDGAQEAFTQAHQLGRLPQPGLARVRLAQDHDAGRLGGSTRVDTPPNPPQTRTSPCGSAVPMAPCSAVILGCRPPTTGRSSTTTAGSGSTSATSPPCPPGPANGSTSISAWTLCSVRLSGEPPDGAPPVGEARAQRRGGNGSPSPVPLGSTGLAQFSSGRPSPGTGAGTSDLRGLTA